MNRNHTEQSHVYYYQPVWIHEPLPDHDNGSKQQTLVLLGDDIQYVQDLKHVGYHVVCVKLGETFREHPFDVYEVNPNHADDYQQLVASWKKKGIRPNKIVKLTSHQADQNRDVQTAFHLVKELLVQGMETWDWLCVYVDQGDTCEQEAMAGFFHSLHEEKPRLNAKIISVDEILEHTIDHVIAEVAVQEEGVVEVGYKARVRHVRRVKPLDSIKDQFSDSSIWCRQGVYILTGGAGALGLKVAEHIASKTQANLILVGRSTLSLEKKEKIAQLNKLGSTVVYHQADITKSEDTKQLITQLKNRFDQIHGVIHMAGCLRDKFLQSKEQQAFTDVLSPKIDGARRLDEALKDEKLDMFVLFSSLISLIGNAGQVDYAYANRYLDAFANKRAKQVEAGERQGVTVSVNWPLWQDGGMMVDNRTQEWMKKMMGIEPLSISDGMNGLETAITSGLAQIIILKGIQENVLSRKVGRHVTKDNRDSMHQNLQVQTEAYLKQVLADEIKVPIDKIKSKSALEDYGIDSVLTVALTRQLEQDFGNVSKTLFYEYQTIAELAAYFVATYKEKLLTILKREEQDNTPIQSPDQQLKASTAEIESKRLTSSRSRRSRNRKPRGRLSTAPTHSREPIAIVGISGRYPQAGDLNEFWRNLVQGKDCIREVPGERWNWRDNFDSDKNKTGSIYTKWGGFMEDVDCFDPLFFNISPKEAELMDPQERLFLETAWHTVEDAGYTRQSMGTDKVGVFVGVMYGQYQMIGVEEGLKGNNVQPSSSYASIANRVSYYMNFKGPSMALDTMCSSSLTAIHLACDSIQKGESDLALAGGVNVSIHPSKYLFLSQGKFASTDGRCRSFGEGGDGYVPGEGTGAVLLKPLRKALEDGDYIYGVIKGSSLNHGGKTNGYTVPNPQMQAELIEQALREADVDPSEVSYIEAHGTGTALGDPIEITGLVKAFGNAKRECKQCAIGSIKSNIGHLESAAGIAGLTKILLQMKHKKLVPTLHAETLNPNIEFDKTPFVIQRELSDWEQSVIVENGNEIKLPRIAGISSFGAGGANAHLIIQEWVNDNIEPMNHANKQLIVLSARNQERLKSYALRFIEFIKREKKDLVLSDVAYTLQVGRETLAERLALVVSDFDDLVAKLTQYVKGDLTFEGAYFGNRNKQNVESILEGETGQQFSEIVIQRGDWAKLGQLWVAGVDQIPWGKSYNSRQPKRVPLPVYPFARERYWIATESDKEISNNKEMVKRLHPLLEKNTSTFEEQCFTLTLTGQEFYLADHHVHNNPVLPGVVYIEMARAAGELSYNQPVKRIKNVVWETPIFVQQGQEPLVSISLYPQNGHAAFEVWTENHMGERIVHSHGEVHYEEHDNQGTDTIEIETIRTRCQNEWQGDTCYQLFKSKGFNYGESFQTLVNLRFSTSEALAEITLADIFRNEAKAYTLHPSLLDGAFQSILGLIEEDGDKTYLPYGVGSLVINDSIHEARYVYVNEGNNKEENDYGLDQRVFNLVIADKNGTVLAFIDNFVIRESLSLHKKSETQVGVFYPNWEEQPVTSSPVLPLEGDILLFAEDDGLFEQVKLKLNNQHSRARVRLVQPGSAFHVEMEDKYMINPSSKADYLKLFNQLITNGFKPTNIIHFWSQAKADYSEIGIKASLNSSVYSLLYVSQAIMSHKLNHTVDLTYIYHEQEGKPLYAANSGWLKTLAKENPMFRCKTLTINVDPNLNLDRLLVEANVDRTTAEVRLTEGKRWVKKVQKLTVNQAFSQVEQSNDRILIKPNGTYVITGGLGELGLIFAKYLAGIAKNNIRLILTGRSPLTADKHSKLQEIERLGADIEYRQADVSIRQDVNVLIAEIKKKYGQVNGIIHSAGVLRDGFVLKKETVDMDAVLAPKVYGTLWLEEATRHEPLDFFVLFSSLSAEIGNPGQSDYAYANAFLDAFAHQRKLEDKSGRTVSINWPLWYEGKMGVNQEIERLLEERMPGLVPLSTEKGLSAFEIGLASSEPQLIVVEGHVSRMDKLFTPVKKKTENNTGANQVEYQEQYKKPLENYLKKMLSDETKLAISQISATEPLEEYGIDSVMVMNMTRELEKDFGELSKTLFFEYQTIQELGDYFSTYNQSKVQELFGRSDTTNSPTPINQLTSYTKQRTNKAVNRSRFVGGVSLKQNQSGKQVDKEDIAIIGLSGRYPMAENVDQLWENLKSGKDCISVIPNDRWNHSKYFDSDKQKKGKTYSKWGGFMDDVDKFDPLVFNISPREAKQMDPQERLFLQTVWHTMEDAGYTKNQLNKHQVGVFVGAMYSHYQMFGANQDMTGQDIPASSFASIANRVSYFFNFNGPSIALDTMCSSSLTAIHLACKSIELGESEVAIAGGVNISIHPHKYLLLSQGKFVSTDGKCRAFGEGGDGYVPGEGVGAVLLKPLRKAVQDGDRIYGVIKSSTVNHGGKTNGYSVPNPNAQADLLTNAFKEAAIDPSHLSYIETHGTGTSLGDPIEITGLEKAIKPYVKEQASCAIGSIKSNIGHLESAAGIAGLTKLLLQMKHKQLVPSIHTDTLNPHINFDVSPFYVQREVSDWQSRDYPRLAGLSSFGAGGSNAHLIVEEWVGGQEISTSNDTNADQPQLIVLSAKNKKRLKDHAKRMAEFLKQQGRHTNNVISMPQAFVDDIRKAVAHVVDVEVQEISSDEEFTEYGYDLARIAQLAQNLSEKLKIDVQTNVVYENNSLKAIVDYLWERDKQMLVKRYNLQPQTEQHNYLNAPSIVDIAHTLQVGREALEERLALIVNSVEELLEKLEQYVTDHKSAELLQGTVKKGEESLQLFDEDEDSQELIKTWITKGKLDKLALLWVNGVDIDWTQMNVSKGSQRISLPGYPFARDRYWIETTEVTRENYHTSKSSHPLIDQLDGKLSLGKQGVVFKKTLSPQSLVVKDHQVKEKAMLPGAAYLEMVLGACREIDSHQSFEVHEVVWKKPMIVKTNPIEVRIILSEKEENVWHFEIQSNCDEQFDSHASGKVIVRDNIQEQDLFGRIELSEIEMRSTHQFGSHEIYESFGSIDLKYGPYFQVIKHLWGNDKEALSQLVLPEIDQQETQGYILPPNLIDGALQTISGIRGAEIDQTETLVPFAVNKLIQLDTLPVLVYAYVEQKQSMLFDIALVDERGKLYAKLEGVHVRALKEERHIVPIADTSSKVEELESPEFLEVKAVSLDPSDLVVKVEQTIMDVLAEVLQIDTQEFDGHAAFTDFGVDSVLAVEIINRINMKLNIPLRTTDLFNYTSIDDLTHYIMEEFVEDIALMQHSILPNSEAVFTQQKEVNIPQQVVEDGEKQGLQNHQSEQPDITLTEYSPEKDNEEIAIIGMSGQFPGAKNLNEFWENLVKGKNTVQQVERWEQADFYSPNRNQVDKSYSKWMGQLADIDQFDPLFFNISPKEAEMIDPQQRLFLMEAWRALEDAGYTELASQNQKCGVFVGCGSGDYMEMMKKHDIPPSAYQFMGNDESILPARISYFLNLKGPSLAINTACSSSLVAVHLACESIRAGTSDMALAGGISILNTPRVHVLASRAGMLSPDGQCKAFDNDANGFVPSEGVGVVVLKPLKKALADGDHILGVIKGSGINQDGKTNGITAPSAPSQTALELDIYNEYQINPADISYVEAHGTGTKLGDPIEVEALTKAFKAYTQKTQYCAIGSVKSNIGHALPAAGIAGLLKILLSLKHKQIAPSLLVEKENEHIAFNKTPFYVNTSLKDWEQEEGKRRLAAISSFGFSGTNAHMVIEEGPPVKLGNAKPFQAYLIPLSAKTESALLAKIQDLSNLLYRTEITNIAIQDLAYTLHIGRSHFAARASFVTSSLDELKTQLSAVLSNGKAKDYRQHNLERNPVQHPDHKKQQGEELLDQLANQPIQLSDARTKLSLLADFYTKGYNLAWEKLYAKEGYRRLSLPTYPFDLQRCWIPNVPTFQQETSQVVERNIGAVTNLTPQVVLRKTVSENDPIVRDHQINGEKLYPGVGFLQLAYEGIQRAGFHTNVTLSNVLWLKPLLVKEKPVELEVSVHISKKRNYYEVKSGVDGDPIVHARGEFVPLKEAEQSMIRESLPLVEIQQRCKLAFTKKDLYDQLASIGMHYGPYFQGVDEIWSNHNEALGYLQLSQTSAHELSALPINPSLLDAALHTISGLTESDQPLVPFGVEQIDVYRKLDSQAYAYVTRIGNHCYDVSLTDATGTICIKLYGVKLVPGKKKTTVKQDYYYQPRWVMSSNQDIEHSVDEKPEHEHVLFIHQAETAGLHSALATEHSENAQIYRIQFGERTQKHSPTMWEINPTDESGMERILSEWEKIDMIYFMSGLQTNQSVEDLNILENCQQTGILSLFRLVKGLNSHHGGTHGLTLKVITNDIFQVHAGDEVRPESASLVGFTKSLAKEYPSWNVKLIDVTLHDVALNEGISNLAKSIVAEPVDTEEVEVAIRHGRRYVQGLESIQLLPAKNFPFKRNGCYLILGGAGGIGLELCHYISEKVQANLVLIGRSPLDKVREEKINQMRKNGSEVLYIQADALNLGSMQQAIMKAKEKFGEINGAVHSAIVLRDKIIANMNEEDLRAALDAKVQGSYILHRVLKNEPLDFMLFFSSVQSFSGNPGQSNYAAGCTFKDAFAKYLMGKETYPVRIINWGYWGTVGIVSSGDYNKRLAQQGVHSILPKEGMEAVVRVLSNRLQQVIPFKADKHVLEQLGIDTKHIVTMLPDKPSHLERGVQLLDTSMMDSNQVNHIKHAFEQLANFGGLLLLNTFKQLGACLQVGEQDTVDSLQKRLGIVPKYRRLLSAGIDILGRLGFVEKLDNMFISTAKVNEPYVIEALSHLASRKQELASTYPEIQAHLNLIWTCYTQYPDILTGRLLATDIMFPNSSMELVENIYRNNKMADYYNQLVVRSIQTYLQQSLKETDGKQRIKILEIGAGTGGTSAHVFEGIRQYGDHLQYVYSDISYGFTQYGKREFGRDNPFVEFKVLDVEKDITEQGFNLGEFDIILATNVLHATRNLTNTLSHIKSLLKTNGWLVVNETTQVHDFATLTFGLLDGWWLYEDNQNRLPNSPLIQPSTWEGLCKDLGYEQFQVLGELGLGQNVMIAESNGLIRQNADKVRPSEELFQQVAVALDPEENPKLLPTQKINESVIEDDRVRNDRIQFIEQIIRESMEEKLGIGASEIQLDKDFSAYGIDSISGVDLINHINEKFDIVLRTTVLFDYKTVQELAEYINEQFNEQIIEKKHTITPLMTVTDSSHQEDVVEDVEEGQLYRYIIDKVVESIEETLGIEGEMAIQLEKPFSTFGIDSISGVNVINTINEKLGILLRTTVLFDYSNMKELSYYINEQYGRKIKEALSFEVSKNADVEVTGTNSNIDLLQKLAKGELSTNEVSNLWR